MELFDQPNQTLVVAKEFRCPSSHQDHGIIVLGLHLADGHVCLNKVAWFFNVGVPAWVKIMDDAVESFFLGGGQHRLHTRFLETIHGIQDLEGLAGIVVPKIETIAGLDSLAARLNDRGLDMPVIGGVETALGVADARSLLAHDLISAAYFGAEDFIADLGGVRTASNDEVAYARAQVALAGRLADVSVIDQIVADFTDDDRCRRECLQARAMGYGGKLCIHPSQVAIANEAFLPSSEEIDRARRLLEAYDDAKAQGVASVAFEGQMVDEPVARQARRVLAQADD